MKSVPKQPEFEEIEPGLYPAVFQGRDGPLAGKFGDFNVWKFDILIGDSTFRYTGITSDNFVVSRRCKAWRWATAIDPTLDETVPEWDDETFIGVKVHVQVDRKTDDENAFLTVLEVFPWVNRQQGPKSGGNSNAQPSKQTLPGSI